MKKLIFFLSLSNIFFFSNPATAQLWKLKNIETIQSKKLIVLLQEPSPVTVNDLKKKGKTAELEQTLAMYTQFNALLQNMVSSKWTFHQKPEFKTPQEFDALSADEKKGCVLMLFQSAEAKSFRGGFANYGRLELSPELSTKTKVDHDFSSLFHTLTFIDAAHTASILYTLYLPEIEPGLQSLHYALHTTQAYFRRRLNDEKVYLYEFIKDPSTTSQRLKDKTLLVLEGDLNPKFTLEELQKNYPYPIKVVKKKDLEAIILSGDPAYAYYLSAPQISSYTSAPSSSNVSSMSTNLGPGRTTISVLHIFMDIQTGDMLAEYQLGSSLFQGPEQSLVLTQKILEKITESFEK